MSKRKSGYVSLTLAALAMLAVQGYEVEREVPVCRQPRPMWYGTHLPKSMRRGKSWQEIQAMRQAAAEESPT